MMPLRAASGWSGDTSERPALPVVARSCPLGDLTHAAVAGHWRAHGFGGAEMARQQLADVEVPPDGQGVPPAGKELPPAGKTGRRDVIRKILVALVTVLVLQAIFALCLV